MSLSFTEFNNTRRSLNARSITRSSRVPLEISATAIMSWPAIRSALITGAAQLSSATNRTFQGLSGLGRLSEQYYFFVRHTRSSIGDRGTDVLGREIRIVLQ